MALPFLLVLLSFVVGFCCCVLLLNGCLKWSLQDPYQRPSCDDLLTSGPLQAALAERASLLRATEELLLLLLLQRKQKQQMRGCARREAAVRARAAAAHARVVAASSQSTQKSGASNAADCSASSAVTAPVGHAALLPPPPSPGSDSEREKQGTHFLPLLQNDHAYRCPNNISTNNHIHPNE